MAFVTQNYTGAGVLSQTYPYEGRYILEQIRLTLDSAASTAENFTCVLDSAAGSQYDVQILTQKMEDVKTFIHSFGDDEDKFQDGDTLVFSYANSDSRTWGLEVRTMGMC